MMNEIKTVVWSPKFVNQIAIGTRSNEIVIMDVSTQVVVKRLKSSKGFVNEIRWNPGGEGVMLVKHDPSQEFEGEGVDISLHASEGEEQQVQLFEHQKSASEVTGIEWVDGISGDFITTSSKVGILKLWNAS